MSSALADGWPQLCSLVTARLSRSGPGKSANWTNWPGHLFDTLLAKLGVLEQSNESPTYVRIEWVGR